MATVTDYNRLRDDIGADEATIDNVEAAAIWDEAAEDYPVATATKAQARVIALRRIWASSAKLTSYQQNQSSESLSDVFKHLGQLLQYWEGQRDSANRLTGDGVARWGKPGQPPTRIKGYPDA